MPPRYQVLHPVFHASKLTQYSESTTDLDTGPGRMEDRKNSRLTTKAWEERIPLSQLCHGPIVTYCMVYHYTKRVTLARLLANEGPAIYVVHLNRYFVIPP